MFFSLWRSRVKTDRTLGRQASTDARPCSVRPQQPRHWRHWRPCLTLRKGPTIAPTQTEARNIKHCTSNIIAQPLRRRHIREGAAPYNIGFLDTHCDSR